MWPASQKLNHDLRAHMREMSIGQRVMARNYRDGPKWISGTIIQRNSPVTYMIQLKSGEVWKRHIQLRKRLDSPQEYIEIVVTETDVTECDRPENKSVDSSSQVSESDEQLSITPSTSIPAAAPLPHRSPYPQCIRHPPDYFNPSHL